MKRYLTAAAAIAIACGCSKKNGSDPMAMASAAAPSPTLSVISVTPTGARGTGASGVAASAAIDFVGRFDDCTLGHRGILLDVGDATARASLGPRLGSADVESVERDGATWGRVTSRAVTLNFVTVDDQDPGVEAVVSARIRGGIAKSVSVYLNGKAVGQWSLGKGEVRVVETRLGATAPLAGTNELKLRFNGVARPDPGFPDGKAADVRTPSPADSASHASRALAEIDWVHVGALEADAPYAAPTRESALVSATMGGIAKRAISLRAPGFARCTGALPEGGRLEASLGLAGAAEGEAEVRLLRDRQPPFTLATFHLSASDSAAWKPIVVPLGELGEKGSLIGAIELVSKSAAKGARILFAEPRVVGRASPPATVVPASKGAILVVFGDLAPRAIALYGGSRAMSELASIASAGVVFDAHRATTTLPSGALASMLTGLSPNEHRVSDPDARLPHGITTIADAARQGGVVTALFTANPGAGTGFGFDRGWDTIDTESATGDAPAVAVFDRAAKWLDLHRGDRFLLVVHARGGHPPWDATPDDLKSVAPPNYTGSIDPKHAAELLSKARRSPSSLHISDADRERMWALYGIALDAHDDALGRLMTALRTTGREQDTTVLVTSDIGVDEGSRIPFGDGDSLEEAALRIPLILRAPATPDLPVRAGTHVATPTSGIDVARSLLIALGLSPPASFRGIDLGQVAFGRTEPDGRPLFSALGDKFTLRWGSFVLAGNVGRGEPKLCSLTLEPVCITDVRATHPLAAEAMHRLASDEIAAAKSPVLREPATLDTVTAAALKAWGH